MRPYRASSKRIPSLQREDIIHENTSKSNTASNGVDDDYMSMDFILNAQSYDKNTRSNSKVSHRSNSNPRKKTSRKRKFRDKDGGPQVPQQKKAKIRMEERRNEGLATPIPETNVGFKLLSKMGYQKGMTIGKKGRNTNTVETTLKEPIGIKIRENKSGLGVMERKEQRTKALSEMIQSQRANRDKIFKMSIRERRRRNQCIREIKQSRTVCYNLDIKKDVNTENPLWFVPMEQEKKWNEEEPQIPWNEFECLNVAECEQILADLLQYLRDDHWYCYWCGIQYGNEQELIAGCPGSDKNLHDSLTDF